MDGESVAVTRASTALIVVLASLCELIRKRKWSAAYAMADQMDAIIAKVFGQEPV